MTHRNLLIVCTDDRQPCGIIDAAQQLAEKEQMDMQLLCVVSADKANSKAMGAQLDSIFERSKQSGAEMIVYFSDKKSDIVRSYITKNNIEQVVTAAGECTQVQCILDNAGIDLKVRAAETI